MTIVRRKFKRRRKNVSETYWIALSTLLIFSIVMVALIVMELMNF